MTREERILHLKMLKSRITVFDEEDNKQIRALQETIQALEQQPCDHPDKCHECEKILTCTYYKQEPSGDAVSRQAVLDLAKFDERKGLGNILHAFDVEQLPSVKPLEKTGHWILQPSNKEQGERDFIWWKCSECGQVIYSETEKDRREYHAFCGRCGARMFEPQERSDKE